MLKRLSTPPTQPTRTKPKLTTLPSVVRQDLDRKDEQFDKELMSLQRTLEGKVLIGSEMLLLNTILRQIGNFDHDALLKIIIDADKEIWLKVLELLQQSIAESHFRTLRRLEILQPKEKARGVHQDHLKPNAEILKQAMVKAWTTKFLGDRHFLLLNNIEKMFMDNPRSYGRDVAIVQSSGSGKTRMVHELSKLVFTIPLNLGSDHDAHVKSHIFPQPDSEVGEYFLSLEHESTLEVAVFRFFEHLFNDITELLKNVRNARSQEQLAVWWSDYLAGGGRREMYKVVLAKTRAAVHAKPYADGNHEHAVNASRLAATTALRILSLSSMKTITKGQLSESFEAKPRVICAVDEAHILMDSEGLQVAKGAKADAISKSRLDILSHFDQFGSHMTFLHFR